MSISAWIRGALICLLAAAVLSAQQKGGTGSTGSGGGGTVSGPGTVTSPGTTRPITTPSNSTTTPGQSVPPSVRPIVVSGKVLLSDGMPPPESVMIQRVCGNRVIPEGYTDSKGRFSFELGANRSLFTDASNDEASSMGGGFGSRTSSYSTSGSAGSSNVTERSLFGCELRASLPGFRSEAVSLTSRRSMDNPDVGTIVMHRIANVEGLTISATSMAAPKDAKKAFDKGRDAQTKGKLDEAAKQLDKAVEIYPKYAIAWYERGRVYEAQNSIDEAKKAYAEALKADSKLITPYERLAGIAVQSRNWREAADTSERMIRLNPVDFPSAFLYNSLANLNLKKLDDAQKSAAELLKMDPQHRIPKAEHIMAVILAQKQDWENAATHFRAFIETSRPGSDVELAKKQLAEVEKTLAAQKQD